MSDSIELSLNHLKKLDRTEDIESVQRAVSAHIPHLTAAALAAALGGTVILKLSQSETGKMKYVPVNTSEEIIQGIDWIATYGNKFDQEGFYIIQQRPPDSKFWDYLTTRHLGKVPDEQKVDLSHKLNLAEVGKKALSRSKETGNYQMKGITEPIPSSWM